MTKYQLPNIITGSSRTACGGFALPTASNCPRRMIFPTIYKSKVGVAAPPAPPRNQAQPPSHVRAHAAGNHDGSVDTAEGAVVSPLDADQVRSGFLKTNINRGSAKSYHRHSINGSMPELRARAPLPCTINPLRPELSLQMFSNGWNGNMAENNNSNNPAAKTKAAVTSLHTLSESVDNSHHQADQQLGSSGIASNIGDDVASATTADGVRDGTASPQDSTGGIREDGQHGEGASSSRAPPFPIASPRRRCIILPSESSQFRRLSDISLPIPENQAVPSGGSPSKGDGSEHSVGSAADKSTKNLVSILRRPRSERMAAPGAAVSQAGPGVSIALPKLIPPPSGRSDNNNSNFSNAQKSSPASSSHASFANYFPPIPVGQPLRRSVSEPPLRSIKAISFDARVWVREFERTREERETTWYSCDDLETFRRRALALILAREKINKTEYLPTGTGRVIPKQPTTKESTSSAKRNRAFFTHSALSVDDKEDESTQEKALKSREYLQLVVQREIRNVLLVDPHDICLSLFAKAMQILLPKAKFALARSGEDAMRHLASGRRFDIILVEERLRPSLHQQLFQHSPNAQSPMMLQRQQPQSQSQAQSRPIPAHVQGVNSEFVSGAALIKTIARLGFVNDGIVCIGVSAHLEEDRKQLEDSNVDFLWNKPPPRMNMELMKELLKSLLIKRNKSSTANELFFEK